MNTHHSENFPEEYTIGSVEFLGKNFIVTPDVLIPRLETEVLIKRARKILLLQKFAIIYDIGSGSGIIGVSLADLAKKICFIDISKKALSIAEKNFLKYFSHEKADFILSDLLEKIDFCENSQNVFLIANLPYIKNNDWGNMSSDTIFEPKIALFGGEKTGFELYEKLFFQIAKNRISGKILIEFGFDQKEVAKNFLQKNFPEWKVVFFADYAGIERFAEIDFIAKNCNN